MKFCQYPKNFLSYIPILAEQMFAIKTFLHIFM
nr:MAG TPA: hypothetical protein [Caudoviricetes sp.]